jgi:hypothetical protein
VPLILSDPPPEERSVSILKDFCNSVVSPVVEISDMALRILSVAQVLPSQLYILFFCIFGGTGV